MGRWSLLSWFFCFLFVGSAYGAPVHHFDCTVCHKAGQSTFSLGGNNVCLQCHKEPAPEMTFIDNSEGRSPHGRFSVQDASDAMGSATKAGLETPPSQQTSHFWASAKDVVPAAGAMAPTAALYRSRYGISTGKVTCTRCHDPHKPQETSPKLLRLDNPDDMCLNCHRPWNKGREARGLETHPLVANYPTFAAANESKYRPATYNAATLVLDDNLGNAEVRLVRGSATQTLDLSCSSCHAPHFVDSDSSTADGRDLAAELNPGDGKLLRGDGPRPASDRAADYTAGAAERRSSLCQTCHTYKTHGRAADGGPLLGCLDCHSGHSYNAGDPYFFVLRKQAFNPLTDAPVTFTGYVNGGIRYAYNSLGVLNPAETWKYWNDRGDGQATGYCETCHGDVKDLPGSYHHADAVCTGCHQHQGENYSFEASCDGCHAYPAEWGSHPAHLSADRMLAPLDCATCHKTAEHLNSLSEVRFDAGDTRVVGATYSDGAETSRYRDEGGTLIFSGTPAYTSCGNLYCHSNAAPVGGVNSFKNPTWGAAAMTCASCHDGGGGTTTLSQRHRVHTDGTTYAISCEKCHQATVSDSATISAPDKHVNRVKDVAFAGQNGLTGSYNSATATCDATYCHSDGRGGAPNAAARWTDADGLGCAGCHGGRIVDAPGNQALQMSSDAHHRLANEYWIRKYPCHYCHAGTVNAAGELTDHGKHVDGDVDVQFDPKWNIVGYPAATYNSVTKNCDNIYCHSDGTSVNPEVRDFPWNSGAVAECDSCHGHQGECSTCHIDDGITGWTEENQWKKATPMYANTGPGTDRANSHVRHLESEFACENCHVTTVVGSCKSCHDGGIPLGAMSEAGHINPAVHVNKIRDVAFKDGGSYDPVTKKCSNTLCHTGDDPVWGDSANGAVICLSCHGTTGADITDYDPDNGIRGRINMTEWATSGHGRPTAAGNYPSGNPPANFPGNPCWYCHDNEVLHKDASNPLRLKIHPQFEKRYEKECVYCHMEGTDAECLGCHDGVESLSTQLLDITSPPYSVDHRGFINGQTSCLTVDCHPDDASQHKTGAGTWTPAQKADIRNQYLMMGVCLQCHDNDDNDRCHSCHSWNGDPAQDPYRIGYDPGTGFISGSSKASSSHFGYKHYAGYQEDGGWRGGKFCWDCHDPHGDNNIYMIQRRVATKTDGTFGIPLERAEVSFTRTLSGLDYAKNQAPYNGICNVCHTDTEHYLNNYGDGHQSGRRCTFCHEHGFGDGHASGQACNVCHENKPISSHAGFGQPRDCVKCHEGVIKQRGDIMRQFRGQSRHVQGVEVNNRHCYACHWEATPEGLINNDYHEGYNYKTHAAIPNAKNDMVIWGAGVRPTVYEEGVTAVTFTASSIGTAQERTEVAKLSLHCLSCHSDQNNDTDTFGDCKTPRQYAWDRTSIAARYSQEGTTVRGKYTGLANAAKKVQTKAFSAHGKATLNQGGWSATTGEDAALPNTRAGTQNVQCFDCHNSHGSYTVGITSSYRTFDNTFRGGNLKETQAGKGGYGATYRAAAVADGAGVVNPMNPGAAQCFDCHETQNAGAKPWGYQSTFGATAPILGYWDSSRFAGGMNGVKGRFAYRAGLPGLGGHLKASAPLDNPAGVDGSINGLCAGCHDPHGVSPSLGADQAYAVPLLKGTWMSSPYKEDFPQALGTGKDSSNVQLDRSLFGTSTGASAGPSLKMSEGEDRFAGLCLRCHPKESLTDGINKNTPFKSVDRIHETVKGWGNNAEHNFTCSKCHQPHSSGLGKLMRTNCLESSHRAQVVSGGTPGRYSATQSYPRLNDVWPACHETITGAWNNQRWNDVTPW